MRALPSRLLLALTATSVLLPLPAWADPAPAGDVTVTAAVATPDGGLSFRTRAATSPAAGEALAASWDDQRGVVAAAVDAPVHLADAAPSDDPGRSLQWGLDALHAEQVWGTTRGAGVTVAVVDTGVDATHPDLAGQVLPPLDVLDPSATRTVSVDPNGHGTHVAGIIAAVAGNGTGVAGLAPGAKVLPVRAVGADGSGTDGDVARGIVAAADAHADVISLSLGGPSDSSVLRAAVSYAQGKGVLVVAAVGNEAARGNPVEYPAALPGVLGVGAVDRTSALAPFSETGPQVDLVAPGVDVVSTWPGEQYARLSGTSMATPFVAAAAALLLGAKVPASAVAARLAATADDLGDPGTDPRFGAGLVDVLAALPAPAVAAPVPAPVTAPAPAPVAAPVVEPLAVPTAAAPSQETPPAVPPVQVPEPVVVPVVVPTTAAPAPVAVLPSAAPSSSPAPAPGVRVSASSPRVVAGAPVVLAARALVGDHVAAGVPVALASSTGAGWAVVRRGLSGPDGLVSWSLQPQRTASYRVVVGDATSSVLHVAVAPRVSAAASRTGVSGAVAPAGRGTVVLQRRTGAGWATAGRATSDASGRFRLAARTARGTVLRVVVAARPGLLGTTSALLRTP